LASSYRFEPFLITIEEDDRFVTALPVIRVPGLLRFGSSE
jgi:hypothetical protein